ncbi:HNH endonuclease [Streptomyces sp. SID4982]|uniref:HNH endonuclease n=1 Tax=Streptomyces sp. SID4982 TaxID=2690291 RepID=UPI001369EA4C|nr:HNH endonuclease [Streptomyces sp. SID4982]MYS16585.1 hypothetical protein [Streptomyces sp. SID4982]
MAVSKRLRYEILRRDNHACRYCGATAPDVKLNVDHVIPQALGGTDKPDNLVTACADCNSGKTSSLPGADPVMDVDQNHFRQAVLVRQAVQTVADVVRTTWLETWRFVHRSQPTPDLRCEFDARLTEAVWEGRTTSQLVIAARSAAFAQNANVDYFAYHVACDAAEEKVGG